MVISLGDANQGPHALCLTAYLLGCGLVVCQCVVIAVMLEMSICAVQCGMQQFLCWSEDAGWELFDML